MKCTIKILKIRTIHIYINVPILIFTNSHYYNQKINMYITDMQKADCFTSVTLCYRGCVSCQRLNVMCVMWKWLEPSDLAKPPSNLWPSKCLVSK